MSSVKQIKGYINLQIGACKANPSPPVGPALGQHGVNIMEFCKSFNDATKNIDSGTPIPVKITVYTDRSFTFITRSPPTSFFLKKAANLNKGSSNTGKGFVGKVSRGQLREIAENKMNDLNAYDLSSAILMLEGSASSMGIEVVD